MLADDPRHTSRTLPVDDVLVEQLEGSLRTFHTFTRLPPELREHIWKLYCPELSRPKRFFELTVGIVNDPSKAHETTQAKLIHCEMFFQPHWKEVPRQKFNKPTVRKLQAIHRETRGLVQRTLPDKAEFELQALTDDPNSRLHLQYADIRTCPASFRYNRDADVLTLETYPFGSLGRACLFDPRVADALKHLNLNFRKIGFHRDCDFGALRERSYDVGPLLRSFRNLDTVYICHSSSQRALPAEFATWTQSQHSNSFLVPSVQHNRGFGRGACVNNKLWTLGTEPNFYELNLPPFMVKRFELFLAATRELGLSLLPMHSFERRYYLALQVTLEQAEIQKMKSASSNDSNETLWETLPYPLAGKSKVSHNQISSAIWNQRQESPTSGHDILNCLPTNAYYPDVDRQRLTPATPVWAQDINYIILHVPPPSCEGSSTARTTFSEPPTATPTVQCCRRYGRDGRTDAGDSRFPKFFLSIAS